MNIYEIFEALIAASWIIYHKIYGHTKLKEWIISLTWRVLGLGRVKAHWKYKRDHWRHYNFEREVGTQFLLCILPVEIFDWEGKASAQALKVNHTLWPRGWTAIGSDTRGSPEIHEVPSGCACFSFTWSFKVSAKFSALACPCQRRATFAITGRTMICSLITTLSLC